MSEVPFHVKTYPRQMLLAILDEGLFSVTYTWPSEANHASTKDVLPEKLKSALISVGRLTLQTHKKLSLADYIQGLRNQFSGNRKRVR